VSRIRRFPALVLAPMLLLVAACRDRAAEDAAAADSALARDLTL
jgi:hypothetical protein